MISYRFLHLYLKGISLNESTYHVEGQFIKMTKFGFWFFACMTALSLGVTFIPEEDGTFNLAGIVTMLLTSAALGAFTIYAYRTLKSFPNFSISIDDEGLWYAHKSKSDGLITWTSIQTVQEKPTGQKLSLKNDKGEKLITVHYQLEGFNELRDKLAEHVRENYSGINEPTFAKGIGHHLFNVLAIGGFIALTIYGYSHFSTFLFWGMVVLVLVCLNEYCSGYYKVYVAGTNLIAKSILRTKSYKLEDIKDVILLDDYNKGSRIPNVGVIFADESGLKLPSMGRSAIEIHIILKNLLTTHSK